MTLKERNSAGRVNPSIRQVAHLIVIKLRQIARIQSGPQSNKSSGAATRHSMRLSSTGSANLPHAMPQPVQVIARETLHAEKRARTASSQ
jgi:hypothetical protein